MFKKSTLIFCILCVFLHVFSQKAVYQLPVKSETTITNPTFFYTLPKTAFKVDIVVTKTSNIKGLYADFAEKMLGITNYCKENTISYELKNIEISPFSVPDMNLQFITELSSKQVNNAFLKSIHRNNATTMFTLSALEQGNADILPDFFKNYADVILQQTHETYTDTKIIDGVVTQVPVTQTKVTSKTLMQQAQEAANLIEKIRNDRYAILSFAQEVTMSKEALEYLVNQLNELEKKYLELFIGIKVSEESHETMLVYPDPESSLISLFSIIPNSGFSSSMSRTHTYNYYLRCIPQVSTSLQISLNEQLAKDHKQKKSTGYQIRKAVPVFVMLVNGDTEKMLGTFSVYQFGLLETLPANLNSFEIEKWGYIY